MTKYFVTWFLRIFFVCLGIVGLIGAARSIPYLFYWHDKKSVSLYMWADQVDEEIIAEFEEKTGIKVYITYYESNEELLTKLEIGKFPECDIMTPSSYMIPDLKDAGLIQPIDWKKITFAKDIAPEFKNSVYDVGNVYSIPLYWDFNVIAYNTEVFPEGFSNPSWRLVFDKNCVPAEYIGMIDDARESICLAMMYLGYDAHQSLTQEQIDTILQTFIGQRQWVGGYSDSQQGYYLASKTYPLVVTQREYLAREKMDYDYIEGVVPEEGSLLVMYNFVVTSKTKNTDLVYQLINFLYQKRVLLHNAQEFRILPTSKSALKVLPDEWVGIKNMLPGQKGFSKLRQFPKVLTQRQVNNLWIKTRSS